MMSPKGDIRGLPGGRLMATSAVEGFRSQNKITNFFEDFSLGLSLLRL